MYPYHAMTQVHTRHRPIVTPSRHVVWGAYGLVMIGRMHLFAWRTPHRVARRRGARRSSTVGRAVRRGVDLLFSRHRAVFVVVVVVVCRVFISRRASSVSGVWCVLVWLVALLHFLARQSRR